jgi:hypothetical protein
MTNGEKAKKIFFDPSTPSGIKMMADVYLGARIADLAEGRPEPALSEGLVEYLAKRKAEEQARYLAGLPDDLRWLGDPDLEVALGGGDPTLPDELQWLNR